MIPVPGCVAAVAIVAALVTMVSADCMLGDFDLSPIGVTQLNIDQDYNKQSTPYIWVISLCGPVSQPPNTATECTAKTSGNVLPGYITEYSDTKCQTSFGKLTGTQSGYNMAIMTFSEASDSNWPGWTATLVMVCGPQVPLTPIANVNVTGANTAQLHFEFQMTTAQVCSGGVPPQPVPEPESSGCGGGCVFVIIVFVGGFVYVAGTVAFYFFHQGKRGLELIPHAAFWKDFASLVKEGAVFSVQKTRGLICKSGPYASGGGYEQV
jgi:hypothetical protein